jgi:hypothetical protein
MAVSTDPEYSHRSPGGRISESRNTCRRRSRIISPKRYSDAAQAISTTTYSRSFRRSEHQLAPGFPHLRLQICPKTYPESPHCTYFQVRTNTEPYRTAVIPRKSSPFAIKIGWRAMDRDLAVACVDAYPPEKPHLRAPGVPISPDSGAGLPKNFTFDLYFFPILLTKASSASGIRLKTSRIGRPESAHRCISRNTGLSRGAP